VLKDLTINIPRGVTYCLLGPNGLGKTVMMSVILGLVKMDAMEIYVLGNLLEEISKVLS